MLLHSRLARSTMWFYRRTSEIYSQIPVASSLVIWLTTAGTVISQ